MTDTTLPPALFDVDSPRARRTDPETSHLAADKSQRGLSELRYAVLDLMLALDHVGDGLTGSEINRQYPVHRRASNLPICHPDSPRKRAGELAEDGYLDIVDHRVGEFGSQEAVYRISPEGRAYLRGVA